MIKMLTQVQHARFVSHVNDGEVIWCNPSFRRICNGSAERLGEVPWLHLLLLVGGPDGCGEARGSREGENWEHVSVMSSAQQSCEPRPGDGAQSFLAALFLDQFSAV